MTLGRNNTSTPVAGKNTNYHSREFQTRRMRLTRKV